jgi:hypothetical protein
MNKSELILENKIDIKQPIYGERMTTESVLDEKAKELSLYEKGEKEPIELSKHERQEILDFEKNIGTKLESIFDINVRNAVFYVEYFLTLEGGEDFKEIVGEELDANTIDDIKIVLHSCRDKIANLKDSARDGFVKRSREYSENRLKEELLKTINENGKINIEGIESPHNVRLVLDDDNLLEKNVKLREFKEEIKKYKETVLENKTDDFQYVYSGILKIYQSKINLMLVGNLRNISTLETKRLLGGEELLSNSEKGALDELPALKRLEKNLARFDKFIYGATKNYDSKGERVQISEELRNFVEIYGDEYMRSVLLEDEQIKGMGLNKTKLEEKNISVEEKRRMAEKILDNYAILSDIPQEEYENRRSGSAEDNKWQFVVRKNFSINSVEGEKKIVKSPEKDCNAKDLISIILGHEIEGHALQHENKSRLPLKIFERVGSGRSEVFAECGAMQNQDFISQKAFGYRSVPKPHYIKTMLRKLEGGNYMDCVNTYYNSLIEPLLLRKNLGEISEEDFKEECKKKLNTAIKSARRLFRDTSIDAPKNNSLVSSKDTAYIEQLILFDKLKKYGLEKYSYFSGANLDSLIFLKKSGLLKDIDILEPKFYALGVWDKMKDRYKLNEQS